MAPDGGNTSFSDLFKLGREILKTETFVLHEAQTRGSPSKKALVKCLFIFGLTKQERAQVGDDVRTFRKAKHACILALQDVISEPEDRFCYLIYEHMPGGSLTDHLGTGRQFTEGEVKAMVSRVLAALASLHAEGLYHGHVTPGRILFTSPEPGEESAATAKLCFLEKITAARADWQGAAGTATQKDLRDADIVSLGLTAFASLMGDAGAAAGEPLESYRATSESTGVPELSPCGREAIDLMLGTDPNQPIPSAVELLRHPWFPLDGIEDEDAIAPMPRLPGQKVAIGPPARPEPVPKGLPPMVPKVAGAADAANGVAVKTLSPRNSGSDSTPWIQMPDGSHALSAWLVKRSNERNALGLRPWHRRWFVLNPSTSTLLIHTHEVDLTASSSDGGRRSSGSIPKAYPLDCAHVSQLLRATVKESHSSHRNCLVLEDTSDRFPSMSIAFPNAEIMKVWFQCFASVKDIRGGAPRHRAMSDGVSAHRGLSSGPIAVPASGEALDGDHAGGEDGDWWDDVSHQAQRVAHVAAASAFAAGGGEAELSRFVEEKLMMHKRSARSLHLNGSIKSGGTSLFGGGGSMVLPTANNAGTIFKNSALQWEHRVEELAAVTAGKPINSAMLPGERWFIVDARWMDHWLEFCTSKRRMAPPGPIDNSWMLHAEHRHKPYDGLTLALGKQAGDYRRVGPECWDQLMRLYGGGPAVYVDGPPVEDLNRWVVRFGHQVSTTQYAGGRTSQRHIPNPSVSVGNLKQAAMKWVGGWDEDAEDDFESGDEEELRNSEELPRREEVSGAWEHGFGRPLGVLKEGSEGPGDGSLVGIDAVR